MKNLLPTSCFTLILTSQIFVSLSQNIKDPFPPQFSPPLFLNPKIQPCKKSPRFLLSGEFHTHKLSYKNPYKISLLMDFHFSVLSEFSPLTLGFCWLLEIYGALALSARSYALILTKGEVFLL